MDPCYGGRNPCQNGATCSRTSAATAECTCTDEFKGDHCDIGNNAGLSRQFCLFDDDTVCIRTLFTLVKFAVFHSCNLLSSLAASCVTNNGGCQNGATCVENEGAGRSCECVTGYRGDACDVEEECVTQSPCQNNGQCLSNADGSFQSCECSATAFKGPTCSTRKQECLKKQLAYL